MKFEGFLIRPAGESKYWSVEIPSLGIYTQGKTKKNAYFMAKDAIECLINKEGFKVEVDPASDLVFTISANDVKPLISLLLKRKRQQKGLTIMEIASRLGSKSPTAYARYEQGQTEPSLDKLSEILKAIDPEFEPILRVS